MTQDLTQGRPLGMVWRFALPVLLGLMLQQVYSLVDTMIVGHALGVMALGGVGATGSVNFLVIGFCSGLCTGMTIPLAQAFGAGDHAQLRRYVAGCVWIGAFVSLAMLGLTLPLCRSLLTWMSTPAEQMDYAFDYIFIIFLGIPATILYNLCACVLRALGDSRSPVWFLAIASGINIVLDLLTVCVLGMGVGGAAFATVISQAVSAFLGLRKLMKATESYRLIPRKIRFNGRMLQKVLYIGIPSGLQNAVIALANVVVQTNINDFGALAQAGCGAYSKIEGFGFLPITSFTLALTTFIGQNLGAQEYERAKKGARFGLIACVSIAEAIGLAIYAFIPALIAMFIQSGDAAQVQEVIRLGTMHARIMTPFYFLLALSNAMAAVLRGAGRSIVPMIVMLCCWCMFRVTYITIAVPIWPELTTISWAYPITWGLSSIIFLIYYNVVDWVHAYGRSKPRKMA